MLAGLAAASRQSSHACLGDQKEERRRRASLPCYPCAGRLFAATGARGGCPGRGRSAGHASRRLDAVAVGVDEADLDVAAVGELEGVGEAEELARTVRVQLNLIHVAVVE